MTTRDIWEAAWLLANGAKLVRIERAYWSAFTFLEDGRLEALCEAYQTGNPTIEVRRYAQACQAVRRAQRSAA